MKAMKVIALTLALGACATPYTAAKAYWTRPSGTLPQLADESEACYRASLDTDAPSAFPSDSTSPRLLPRTEPPPKLWEREPRTAGFERFDEQLRYERCMRVRGWRPGRGTTPAL
jgi:hypothetical protein